MSTIFGDFRKGMAFYARIFKRILGNIYNLEMKKTIWQLFYMINW